jgi:hypothetical protein
MPTKLPPRRFRIATSLAVRVRAKLARYLRRLVFMSYKLHWTTGSYVSGWLMKVATWVTVITKYKAD